MDDITSATFDLAKEIEAAGGGPIPNPFLAPAGKSPVESLPPELIAHIFVLGVDYERENEMEGSEDDDENWSTDGDSENEGDGVSFPLTGGAMDTEGPQSDSEYEVVDKFGHRVKRVPKEDLDMDEIMEGFGDEEPQLPFQILVSHVCAKWRTISLGQPQFWNRLLFGPKRNAPYGPRENSPWERSKAYIARSGSFPLRIDIETAEQDEDDLGEPVAPAIKLSDLEGIMNMLVPEVHRWSHLTVDVGEYEYMFKILQRLAACSEAPLLNTLQLRVRDDPESTVVFQPSELREPMVLFHDKLPKLENLSLWGTHLAWGQHPQMFSNVSDLEIAYHADDVKPTWEEFSKVLTVSPSLSTFAVQSSGPKDLLFLSTDPNSEPLQRIQIPTLKSLVLEFLEPAFVEELVKHLSVPNVTELALDLDDGDYTSFLRQLVSIPSGQTKSILANLNAIKIAGISCDHDAVDMVYRELVDLEGLNLNVSFLDERWLERLSTPIPNEDNPGDKSMYLPKLKTLTTSGVEGEELQKLVQARKEAGSPIKKVIMSGNDKELLTKEIEEWLMKEVDLEFFESDGEYDDEHDEMVLLDGDEEVFG